MNKSIFLAIILVMLMVVTVAAQDKKYEIVVGGGIDSPLRPDEFTDLYNLGFTGKLAAGYFIIPNLTLGANISYNRFGIDKGFVTGNDPAVKVDGGNLGVFEFAGVAKYYLMAPSAAANFYLLGGPGIAYSRISDLKVTEDGTTFELSGENATDFMLTGGFGVKYNIGGRTSLFIEGRYSHVFTDEDNISYLPVRAGVVF